MYRDYEELAQEGGEDSEELTNNQTIFDTAKSRLLDLKKVIEDEDTKRNLFTFRHKRFLISYFECFPQIYCLSSIAFLIRGNLFVSFLQ